MSTHVCRADLLTCSDLGQKQGDWHSKWSGAVRPNLEWCTEFIEAGQSLVA